MLSEKRGFEHCTHDSHVFIQDLLTVLPLHGVKELYVGRYAHEWQERLSRGLDVIGRSVWKRCERIRQKDRDKAYGLLTIALSVSPSHFGVFDAFWSAVQCSASWGTILWRSDGVYLLQSHPSVITHLLKEELEPDYARLVNASAKIVARKLRQA